MEGVVGPCVGEVVGEGVGGVGEGVEGVEVEVEVDGEGGDLAALFPPFFFFTIFGPRADPSKAAKAPPLLCINCISIFLISGMTILRRAVPMSSPTTEKSAPWPSV